MDGDRQPLGLDEHAMGGVPLEPGHSSVDHLAPARRGRLHHDVTIAPRLFEAVETHQPHPVRLVGGLGQGQMGFEKRHRATRDHRHLAETGGQRGHDSGGSLQGPGLVGVGHDGRERAVEVREDGSRGRTDQQGGQGGAQVRRRIIPIHPATPLHPAGGQLTVDVVAVAALLSARSGPTTTSTSAVPMELTGAEVV